MYNKVSSAKSFANCSETASVFCSVIPIFVFIIVGFKMERYCSFSDVKFRRKGGSLMIFSLNGQNESLKDAINNLALEFLKQITFRIIQFFTFSLTVYDDMNDIHLVIKKIIQETYGSFHFFRISYNF